MKTLIVIAATTLMITGAVANEISSRYVYGDAPRPSENVSLNLKQNTGIEESGSFNFDGTASATVVEPGDRLGTSLHVTSRHVAH